mmetsp:Transcript_38648/g.82191  ORF Transcript_38648/g.82191 Transcript_38648/m.82191 type:complete len:360 (+) Transcript_38648:1-1080(+)
MQRFASIISAPSTCFEDATGESQEQQSGGSSDTQSNEANEHEESQDEDLSKGFFIIPMRKFAHFDECYKVQNRLAEGAFGVVYLCTDLRGEQEYAVKVVQKDRLSNFGRTQLLGDDAAGKEGEIRLHRSIPDHDHIVGLRACFEDPWAVRLVVEICHGGDLFDAINKAIAANRVRSLDLALSEQAASLVVQQVLSGLAFCHAHGVVHRDVKAENILIAKPLEMVPLESSEAMVKLCDFGLAARCWPEDGLALMDAVGSPDYVAPEVARREAYGSGVDVWSAGVLLFASLRGRLPFPARTDREAFEHVQAGRCHFDRGWQKISPEARDCAKHLLVPCASARPTAAASLRHPWWRSHGLQN